MKELKIEVPEGYKIDRENSTFEKIVFKKVERELPKRWEDLEGISGFYVSNDSKVEVVKGCFTKEETKNTFPSSREAEACLALSQLCQLRDRYNDGWKPDWKDDTTIKYCIGVLSDCICPIENERFVKVLAFKTEELRDEFLENFRDLIKTAKPLL